MSEHRVAVVANPARPGVGLALVAVVSELTARGCRAAVEPDLAARLDVEADPLDWDRLSAALVVTLGGDGTLLRAVRMLNGRPVPLFGINMGGLGFLTASGVENLWPRLDEALAGRAPSESRMTLAAEVVREGQVVARHHALNDAVVHKGGTGSRVVRLGVSIDRAEVGAYLSDGLILSTPTGATGYSLSAGGPLVVPDHDAIVVAPICAHSLAIRPIVTAGDARIEVRVEKATEKMFLVMDGQIEEPLSDDDVVRVGRGDHRVTLVGTEPAAYFERLRTKLMWGARSPGER